MTDYYLAPYLPSGKQKKPVMCDLDKYDLESLSAFLMKTLQKSEVRCLRKACEFIFEILSVLPQPDSILDMADKAYLLDPKYELARACFEQQQYDRAADLIRNPKKDGLVDRAEIQMYHMKRFLHYFSLYKAAEKKRIDIMNEVSVNIPKTAMLKFNELRDSLERSITEDEADGWLLYVYGIVLHKFRLQQKSILVLVESINRQPNNWSAWYKLSTIIDDEKQLHDLYLPSHPFRSFFYYMMSLELDLQNLSFTRINLKHLKAYMEDHLKDSLFIKTLIAKSLSRTSGRKDQAISLFREIREADPHRVDSMDIYSNALYVRKMKKELAQLAYDMERVDPFTPETNCCIANSYSARDQHTKAIVYFTRALKLNPDHANSWTLIGHEYLEVKSIEKALQAYRSAIYINKRDHRAWLGLGNTYETIQNNLTNANYKCCLYYYSQVAKYRPNDHNMFLAMGSIYEKMSQTEVAIWYLKRAGKEGAAMLDKLETSRRERQDAEKHDCSSPDSS